MLTWAELVELSDLQRTMAGAGIETVTPMRLATIITLDDAGMRRAVRMRWGLIAPGASDTTAKPHIHARAETIDHKPTFRDAFRARRGLLVVATFNEGREITPTRTEQHVLTPKDGAPVAIAVVWERFIRPQSAPLLTFAMVTTPPNELIGTITDRMPALITPADWGKWLGEVPASLDEIKALLKPSDRGLDMKAADDRHRRQPDLF